MHGGREDRDPQGGEMGVGGHYDRTARAQYCLGNAANRQPHRAGLAESRVARRSIRRGPPSREALNKIPRVPGARFSRSAEARGAAPRLGATRSLEMMGGALGKDLVDPHACIVVLEERNGNI